MPLAALVCYCHSCKGDKAHDPETVLAHAAERNNPRFPYELLRAMLNEVQDRGKRISATTVLSGKCLRSEVMKRTRPYTDDPAKLYASFRGTMFHGRLEQTAHPESIAEARFHKHLDGLGWFSGSPDLLDPVRGYLYDYKFTGENPKFEYPWKDHREQMQVNRWLIDTCDYVELPTTPKEVFPLTEAGAQALGMGFDPEAATLDAKRFRPFDWQALVVVYMDDKGPKPIACTKSIDVPQKGDPERTKKARVPDIWDDARVEELVRANYAEAQHYLTTEEIPPIPEDYQGWKHPLCNYCPVKDDCVQQYIEEQVALRQEPA